MSGHEADMPDRLLRARNRHAYTLGRDAALHAIRECLADDAAIRAGGQVPVAMTPAEFGKVLADEAEKDRVPWSGVAGVVW
jgi:hypothetical protein